MLNHHVHPHVLLLALTDLVLAAVSFVASFYVSAQAGIGVEVRDLATMVVWTAVFSGAVLLGTGAMGLYYSQQRHRIEGVLVRMLIGLGVAATAIALLNFLFPFIDSSGPFLLAFFMCACLLSAAKMALRERLDHGIFRRRVLIYGAGKRASRILQLRRRSDQRGYQIVAFLPAPGDSTVLDDVRVIKDAAISLVDYVRVNDVNEIVVAVDDRRRAFPVNELLECKLSGARVIDVLGFLERESGRVKIDMVNPSWFIFSEGFDRVTRSKLFFRALDLFVCTGIALVAIPLMAIVAVAILLDDGLPVLYRQDRVGLNGKVFTLYKFRSMRKDAEASGEARWAAAQDDRVTFTGRYLRKLRFDELPQLLNILRGDMGFVGPRPERPEFVSKLVSKIPYYAERHCVKPGLTGWAQLCYPYGASEKDALAKLEFDMYYIKNRSIIFDLIILLQTLEVVLSQRGSR